MQIQCVKCKKIKDETEFTPKNDKRNGRDSYCKQCKRRADKGRNQILGDSELSKLEDKYGYRPKEQ